MTALFVVFALSATPTKADTFGSGGNMFDIEFVTIGNPGNADDTMGNPNPAGSVPYNYRIGKFEISGDMIDKANAQGSLSITRFDFGPFGPNKPAGGISWFEAAQFVNWFNTDSGSTPAYNFNPNGVFQLWHPDDAGYDPNNLYRNSLATYFLPSVDEWYKAAYYDPNSDVYYDYPTGSDTPPTAVASGTVADTAVYEGFDIFMADITLAGGLSPYGTMGQGGNAWEWEETEFDLVNDSTSSIRGRRGGSVFSDSILLSSSLRDNLGPATEFGTVGFRVASSIPEPSTFLLAALALFTLLAHRRRTA